MAWPFLVGKFLRVIELYLGSCPVKKASLPSQNQGVSDVRSVWSTPCAIRKAIAQRHSVSRLSVRRSQKQRPELLRAENKCQSSPTIAVNSTGDDVCRKRCVCFVL